MKASWIILANLMLFGIPLAAPARDAVPHYKFIEGQTNVFTVEIVVRGENGSETNSGNVILVTKAVSTNCATLFCRGMLKKDMSRTFLGQGRNYVPTMFYPENVFPVNCEIQLDFDGNEIRDGGDYLMNIPLGKLVGTLYAPLPKKLSNETDKDKVYVLDDPLWVGPSVDFLNLRQNGQPFPLNFYLDNGKAPMAALLTYRTAKTGVKTSTSQQLQIFTHLTLESPSQVSGRPSVLSTSDTEATFDRNLGMLTRIETHADVDTQTESSSRHARVFFKSRLLRGKEFDAALLPFTPPVPGRIIPPRNLSGDELEKFIADIKSPDIEVRRGALRRTYPRDIDSPSQDVIEAIAAMTSDTDMFVRSAAVNLLGNHATTNEVPILIKCLTTSDWMTREPAIKALGRLRDLRAVQPLCDFIVRNGNLMSPYVVNALEKIGAPAEPQVRALLDEKNVDTQRTACNILRQIGTSESIDALKRIQAGDDATVSQAAADAIRDIKQRQ